MLHSQELEKENAILSVCQPELLKIAKHPFSISTSPVNSGAFNLQVHDELVFVAADDELHLLVPEVIKIMERKSDLLVPLKVNLTVGKNWLE